MKQKGSSERSQNRGAHLAAGTGACLFSLVLLFCVPAWTQAGIPSSILTASQPEVPKDALGRTTPRGTVLGFVTAAHKGDYELAAQYLNTRLRGKAATDLAHKLFVVLDRSLPPELNTLSNSPEGSLSNPLKPGQDLVGTISSASGDVDIILERVDRGKSGPIWMFSSKTLGSIPDLFAEINEVKVENVLPGFLVNTRLAGIVLFEWLAVFVGMPMFYLLTTLLSRVLNQQIGYWRRRLRRRPDLPNPQVLPIPLRLLLLAAVIHWLLSELSLPLMARQFWSSTARIITIVGCVWLLILLSGWVEGYIRRKLLHLNLTGTTSMLRLALRATDGLIVFAGGAVALNYFGVKPTAALAGLGVGGIAVALAAQKTLENIIGGISLILDGAVRAGDTLKVGETVGTVDFIGLRSIRIRTVDRTMVSVPNGQLANLSLEIISARDKFWFHPVVGLHYETTLVQIQSVLTNIRKLLAERPGIDQASVRARLLSFGGSSFSLDIFAYVHANDWAHFLEVQEELLMGIMDIVREAGAKIALPSQTMYIAADSSEEPKRSTNAFVSKSETPVKVARPKFE